MVALRLRLPWPAGEHLRVLLPEERVLAGRGPLRRGVSAAAGPEKGDVRHMLSDPSRRQRYDGRRWQSKCEAEGCMKRPLHGCPVDGKLRRCSPHQRDGDIDLTSKMCEMCLLEDPPMRTHASFGDPEDRKTRFCSPHKREGDIDLVSKVCEVCLAEAPAVRTVAAYGNPEDRKRRFCSSHKREGDVHTSHIGADTGELRRPGDPAATTLLKA